MSRRRVWALGVVVGVLVVLGGIAAGTQALANKERVTSMWVGAVIRADGSARITEVVDYDFGHSGDTHGIYRDVPDADFYDNVRATMDGHKVPYESGIGDAYRDESGRSSYAERLKVGDPGHTVGGIHRYLIQYTLPDVVKGHKLAWDAVGTGWKVDRADVEIHVVDAYGFTGVRCEHGSWDAGKPCTAGQSEPGHLVIRLDRLTGHEGVTLYATAGKTKAAGKPVLPAAPSGPAVGTTLPHPMRTGGLFLAAALAAVALTVLVLRFLGRDRLAEDGGRERGVAVERLRRTVAPSAAPPDELTPAQGGILLTETVEDRHRVAWLLTAAADGHLSIGGDHRRPVLRRRERAGEPVDREVKDILGTMFGGRDSLTLGMRDALFRSGWQSLATRLHNWCTGSDLWDFDAACRAETAGKAGAFSALAGFVLVITGGVLTGRRIAAGWPVVVAAAVVSGIGLTLAACGWELDRRTARGTALWLRVEAFRRYLADPGTVPGELPTGRQADLYTAWAVALGVESAWEEAVGASAAAPGRRTAPRPLDRADLLLAAMIVSSSSPPSSSGGSGRSGGSGGGSSFGGVGGGAGGGGGGSW
ncbi:DUF2207 domain-containing protein [Streptomyces sp. NPDC086519]|uniref:DUF2207 domain-containing protein n=1 Tax=Streptomyces sp. NPDC086519 TaxID=3154863 RepID=UPI003449FB2A